MSAPVSLQSLIADLQKDAGSDQQPDILQFCADWFQAKLRTDRSSQQTPASRAAPATPVRKFPNFPTMALPQAPANVFTHHLAQPSPFSEHPPSDSPFGNPLLSQRRSTLASTGSASGASAFPPSNPVGGSATAFGGYQMGGTASAKPLGELPEEESAGEDDPMSDAPPSFARFSFNGDAIDNSIPSDPSPFEGNPFPSSAGPASVAQSSSDELRPPSYALGRRTSVSAESLMPSQPMTASRGPTGLNESVQEEDEDVPSFPPKSESQTSRIKQAIGHNFLFRNLDEEQERDVLNAMREVSVQQGEVVIEQGAAGDYFYVIESGEFDIYKKSATGESDAQDGTTAKWGPKVHTAGTGGSFGELALMYNAPRAATVIAKDQSTLWALDRISFRTILLDHTSRKRRMYEAFLSTVPILSSLEGYERAKIADALEPMTFQAGEEVIREGEAGDEFYLIESGVASVEKAGSGIIGELSRGDYFGELALLNRASRAATVRASGVEGNKLRVAALGEKAFTRLLGPVREIMARKAGERYSASGLNRS